MSPIFRAWFFLSVFSMTLIVFGHSLGGREGLLISLVLVLATNSFIFLFEDRRILTLFKATPVEGRDPYGLQPMVHRLSLKARISTPIIYLIESPSPQTAVLGQGIKNGVILITSGLTKKLNPDELEAILAHQIVSLKNLNTLAYSVASFLSSCIIAVTGTLDFLLRTIMVEKKNLRSAASQIFTRAALPFISLVLRISVRPSFYLHADFGASQLIAEPKSLARALWKLDSFANTIPLSVPISAGPKFIVNPLTQAGWMSSFNTHPETKERIERLIGYYPI